MSDARPAFQGMNMGYAHGLARRSTCKRLQVGTMITSTDHCEIFAIGYNGTASGLPHNCRADQPGNCGCLHSEDNAVAKCGVSRATPKLVYVTHLPCEMCAKRFINMGGVQKVYYTNEYRDKTALSIFQQVGIPVERIEPELHYQTQEAQEAKLNEKEPNEPKEPKESQQKGCTCLEGKQTRQMCKMWACDWCIKNAPICKSCDCRVCPACNLCELCD